MSLQKFQCPSCGANIELQNTGATTISCPYCRTSIVVPDAMRSAAIEDFSTDPMFADVWQALQVGNKIEAIKRYRENFGGGLKEAKDAVEQMEAGHPVSFPASMDGGFANPTAQMSDNVLRLIGAGKKIEAIKLVRDQTGLGLAEAKDAVERIERGQSIDGVVSSVSVVTTQPTTTLRGEPANEIYRVLQSGNKIQAIKMMREQTGIGLAEAKAAVEAMELSQKVAGFFGSDLGGGQGQTITAINNATPGGLVTIVGGQSGTQPLQPTILKTQRRGGCLSLLWFLFVALIIVAFVPLPWSTIAHRLNLPDDALPINGQSLLEKYLPAIEGAATQIAAGPQPIWVLEGEGTGQGSFDDPRQIALDGAGNVYVADFDTGRIQKFSPSGEFLSLWRISTDTPIMGLAADNEGRVYVAKGNKINIYDGNSGESIEDISIGLFSVATSVVATSDGGYLVGTMIPEEEVLRRNGDGTNTLTINKAVSGITGDLETFLFAVEDGDGNIFVLGRTNNTVVKYNAMGMYLNRFGSVGDGEGQFSSNTALSLAVDSHGRVYLGHFGGIIIYDNDGRYLGSIDTSGAVYDMEITDTDEIVVTMYGKVAKYPAFVSE